MDIQTDVDTGAMRATFTVSTDTGSHELWFEVPEGELVTDRCDAVVVAMLPVAMLQGYDAIQSDIPISEALYYNLTFHVIPQLALGSSRAKELKIEAPRTLDTYASSGVGAGMSLGIDSFATLREYADPVDAPQYKITHLAYFNVGAHHGFDVELGRSELSRRELYEGQLLRVQEFCREHGYRLLVLDSNLAHFLRVAFRRTLFKWTHTYRNAAAVLMLQNVLGTYFYSSAFNLNLFEFSLRTDTAAYEKWLLPYLSNGNTRFLNSGRAWSRFEKTQTVSQMPESYKYLTVCLVGVRNCGKCMKCRKTLMALDALGDDVLDLYASSFDLDEYRATSRGEWFSSIYSRMAEPGLVGDDMKEIYRAAQARHAPFLPPMPVDKVAEEWVIGRTNVERASVRVEPDRSAAEIMQIRYNYLVECLGYRAGWVKIRRFGLVGYIDAHEVAILNAREIDVDTTVVTQEQAVLLVLPSSKSQVVEELDEGSALSVMRSLKRFYFVRTPAGRTGWVAINSVA